MRIPDDKVEEIRSAIDIVDVVSDYVTIKKKGANFFGLCPFHDENTPSFSVNSERGIYKCFGCGKGGDVISFLIEIERLGFVDAVRLLADRAGVELPEPTAEATESSSETESIYHALRLAGRFFHANLVDTEEGAAPLQYLRDRGFSDETIRTFGIGFAPDRWDALLKHAEAASTAVEHLELAGLIIKSEKGEGHYDRFRNRVMFPLFSHVGQVVGFTGRILEDTSRTAKYVNSPETKVYHKGNILYGLNLTRNEIRRLEEAYLVEGNTDVVSLYQAGVRNVAATSGTALTPSQVKLLGRYTNTVVILFDADDAGVAASLRSIDLMLAADMRAYVLSLPAGSDPDSFVRERGRDGFLAYADKHRKDFVSFKLEASGYMRNSGDPESDWDSIRSVLTSIAVIPNTVRRDGYLRLAAEKTGMLEGTLRTELDGIRRRARRRPARGAERGGKRPYTAPPDGGSAPAPSESEPAKPTQLGTGERDLLRLMLSHGERLIGYVLANMSLDEFSEGPSRKTAEELLTMYQKASVDSGRLVSGDVDPDVREFVAGLMIQKNQPSPNWRSIHSIEVPPLDANAKRSASDAMRRLKMHRIDSAIEEENRKILSIEQRSGDATENLRKLQTLHELRKRLKTLEFVEWG